MDFIVRPFGKKLNSELFDVFNKLDFPDKIIKELKEALKTEPRKNLRKPATPSKIEKEEINPTNS
jgi:hypothetical protein